MPEHYQISFIDFSQSNMQKFAHIASSIWAKPSLRSFKSEASFLFALNRIHKADATVYMPDIIVVKSNGQSSTFDRLAAAKNVDARLEQVPIIVVSDTSDTGSIPESLREHTFAFFSDLNASKVRRELCQLAADSVMNSYYTFRPE